MFILSQLFRPKDHFACSRNQFDPYLFLNRTGPGSLALYLRSSIDLLAISFWTQSHPSKFMRMWFIFSSESSGTGIYDRVSTSRDHFLYRAASRRSRFLSFGPANSDHRSSLFIMCHLLRRSTIHCRHNASVKPNRFIA